MAFKLSARLALAAASMAAALSFGSPAMAQSETLNSVMGFLGLQSDDKPEIEYRERAPLVVPPKMELRPPQQSGAGRTAAWPTDADVVKTYVELGLGVGIVASIAYDEERDRYLRSIDARHLFAMNMTRLAVRRGTYLRAYVYSFIESFAPPLTRAVVDRALAAEPGAAFEI